MNFVALDPSLISTALVVNGRIFNYCRESKVYGKKSMTKWFKMAEPFVTYRFIEYRGFKDYSEGELIKLKDYDLITDMIIDDILENIDESQPTKIGIEGYSFSSTAGDLIDLVTFSTILRKKLYDRVSKDILVMSPSTLKLESCKLSYQPIVKEIGGKKKRTELIWRNKLGISGGSFKKRDMFTCIVDSSFTDPWSIHCKSVAVDVLSVKEVQKPYEDCTDAFLIYKVLRNQNPD